MFSQRLRHRITIQHKNGFLDNFGQMTETWNTLTNIWAHVIELTGKEYFSAQATQNQVVAKIVIRTRTPQTITAAMRVIYGSKTYNIESVVQINEHETHLLCSTGAKYV